MADVLEWKRIVVCLYKIPKKERVLARRNKSNGMYSGKASEQCKIFVFFLNFIFLYQDLSYQEMTGQSRGPQTPSSHRKECLFWQFPNPSYASRDPKLYIPLKTKEQ